MIPYLQGLLLLIQLQTAADPLRPDLVLDPPDGPRIVLFSTPGAEGVALRLHIPFREGEAEAGWGWILHDLALARGESATGGVGALIQGRRTPWGLSYLVAGPQRELDHLGWLLRVLLQEPDGGGLEEVRLRAQARRESRWETPDGRLTDALLDALAPGRVPPEGTMESLRRLSPGVLREFWTRTHARSRMTLVVAGDVTPESILAMLQGVGSPESGLAGPLDLRAEGGGESGRPPPPLRSWYGEGILLPPATDPVSAVVTRKLSRRVASGTLPGELRLEVHPLEHHTAVTLRGAVPLSQDAVLRQALEGVWGAVMADLTEAEFQELGSEVLLELMDGASTPWGLVEREGWLLESGGAPGSLVRYRDRLPALSLEGVRQQMERALGGPRASAAFRP